MDLARSTEIFPLNGVCNVPRTRFLIVFLHGGALVDAHSLLTTLNPIEGNLLLQLPADVNGLQVDIVPSDRTDLVVFAPAHSRVLLSVNDIPFQSFEMPQAGVARVMSVPIRYGPNHITGLLLSAEGGDYEWQGFSDLDVSGGKLPLPAEPVILARSTDSNGDRMLAPALLWRQCLHGWWGRVAVVEPHLKMVVQPDPIIRWHTLLLDFASLSYRELVRSVRRSVFNVAFRLV